MRVRYIERSPEKLDMIFKNSEEFWTFYDKRCRFILDLYGNYDEWDREHFKITKKGKPRKYHYPKQLFTEEAKENQKKGWKKYLKKRLDVSEMRRRKVLGTKIFAKQVNSDYYFLIYGDKKTGKLMARPLDEPYAQRLLETERRVQEEFKNVN
jgi:hypothetical protein